MTSSFTLVDKQIAFAFLKYLDEVKANGKTTDESLDVAKDCLKAVFAVDTESAEDQKSYGISESLTDMFSNSNISIENSKEFKDFVQKAKDKGYFGSFAEGSAEYKEKYETLLKKYTIAHSKSTAKSASQEPPPPPAAAARSTKSVISPEKRMEADKYKEEGNELLKSSKYQEAYDAYSKAIETNSDGEGSHIYYSNRAAASIYLNNYDDAINDCKRALEIDPTYIRALVRLSKAYMYEKKYADAEECLERAKRLDSENNEVKNLLNEVKDKRKSENGGATGGGIPNIPNLDNLGGLGGLGGLGDLLNNPAIRSVAQNLMQNPDLMNMATSAMQNPEFLNMMGGMLNGQNNGGANAGAGSGGSSNTQ